MRRAARTAVRRRLRLVRAAPAYTPAPDLWVVTSYFNPTGYRTKRRNFERFSDRLRASRLRWLAVECAFGAAPFVLPPSPHVVHVRARDIMWQKERLLNVAIARLPPQCTKVAWLDADVLFADPGWAVRTASLLERYPVVQPFKWVIRLPRGFPFYLGLGRWWKSFAAVYAGNPSVLRAGKFDRHGHTGFGWAARRELLGRHGLYDACIAGSGDHMMAHAMAEDWTSACIDRILGDDSRHRDYFRGWAEPLAREVDGRIGYVSGTLLHLWHGRMADRKYVDRNRDLLDFGFDPVRDLRVGAGGCWEWNSARPELHAWAADYFARRKEDGRLAL